MTVQETIGFIKNPDADAFSLDIIQTLADFSQDEFNQVIASLLREPVLYNPQLHGQAYRDTYRCQVIGCRLFKHRPDPSLYTDVLIGALGIGDPASIQFAARALLHAKPPEKIMLNLLGILDKYRADEQLVVKLDWLAYWIPQPSEYIPAIGGPKEFKPLEEKRKHWPPTSDPTKFDQVISKALDILDKHPKDQDLVANICYTILGRLKPDTRDSN